MIRGNGAPKDGSYLPSSLLIVTRREQAPQSLTRDLIDGFVEMLGRKLRTQIVRRSFALKFRNTLSAIAGLFRWRIREHFLALTASPLDYPDKNALTWHREERFEK